MFTVSGAYAATEFALPELEWGVKRDVIAGKAQGELYHEEDAWLWYTSYDAYDGCIVETQYRFNADNELNYVSWHMRPQIESDVGLAQMLMEYNRLKEVLLLRHAAPSCGNQLILKHGKAEKVTYPDAPSAPTAADIQPGTQYSFENRWCSDEIAIFLHLSVSESGRASINVSFQNQKYE